MDGGCLLGRRVVQRGVVLLGPCGPHDLPGGGGFRLLGVRAAKVSTPRRAVSRGSSQRGRRAFGVPQRRCAHEPPPFGTDDTGPQAPRIRRGRSSRQRPRVAAACPYTLSFGERLEAGTPRPACGVSLHVDAHRLRKHRRGRGTGAHVCGTGEAADP